MSAPTESRSASATSAKRLPAVVMLLFALVVGWLGYAQDDPEPFLFPQLLSAIMIALALVNLISQWRSRSANEGQTIANDEPRFLAARRMAPGIVVLGLIVWFAESVGFYTTGLIAVFAIYCLYDPHQHTVVNVIGRLLVSFAFMAVMYGLFALVLQVQTPRGLLL